MHHDLEETTLTMKKKAFFGGQSDYQSSRRPTSIEKKRLDLMMLKEKKQN